MTLISFIKQSRLMALLRNLGSLTTKRKQRLTVIRVFRMKQGSSYSFKPTSQLKVKRQVVAIRGINLILKKSEEIAEYLRKATQYLRV